MLKQNKKDETFGFFFKGEHQEHIVGLHSIGGGQTTSPSYDWNGLKRSEIGRCVFQYTLSGKGMIEVDGKMHPLSAGQAFLVQIPSEHRYFLPKESNYWEFVHITLFGYEAQKAFTFMNDKIGHVISFPPESPPIRLLLNILQEAYEKKITDAYHASALGYSFIMELYRFAQNIGASSEKWPEQISKAVFYAQKHYDQPIGLDDMVEASGLSKYHFTRLFHKVTGMTPLKYLTKIRIDKAIELLHVSQLSIEEIATQVGYSNGNYFSKVFHKKIGMSPGQFRQSRHTVPVTHIVTD
ncbi:AraC family transcriptional regulator [Lederbergia citrea]|uniref:Helix-turn-helix transcriptional regulator n=1 Tax=Lederbergia citrea TaxID=2833581 RepID=A0A942Z531_9BACI|nr:AraC family transcriptional regulator [Lederbergia citrea]MBS4178464.1 helix-turn-helix transcriptional regulator [Lederbergia citrea]MBS4205136.1 helix-turn-helix transcriptional regulator [Lederbergia citrea]MBS4223002.1 helix-turn-helix transcriptional regulator [Lederbergia citrea]